MNTQSGKIGARRISHFDWDKFATEGWDALKELFKSGKLGGGTNTGTGTDTNSPATDTNKGGDNDNTTMYWIIGGMAFVMVMFMAIIALKK